MSRLNDSRTFSDVCNRAARDLPGGWEITVRLARNAGSVDLEDPFGDDVEFPTNHEHIEQTLLDAIEHAKNEDAHFVRGPLPGEIRDNRWTEYRPSNKRPF